MGAFGARRPHGCTSVQSRRAATYPPGQSEGRWSSIGRMLGRLVSQEKVRGLVAQAQQSSSPWILFDEPEFRSAYNKRPFLVRHRLAEHPLFEYRALAALCRRMPASQV